MPTLEAGQIEDGQVGMPRGGNGAAHTFCALLAEKFSGHTSRMSIGSSSPKNRAHHFGSLGRLRIDRDRVAPHLELFGDAVVEPRVLVVGPADHQDGHLVLALHALENLAPRPLDALGCTRRGRSNPSSTAKSLSSSVIPSRVAPGVEHQSS